MASESTLRLLVTSGDGPRECWRAVALCAQLMQQEATELGFAFDATSTGNHEDPQSLLIRLAGTAPENWARQWIGTVKMDMSEPVSSPSQTDELVCGYFYPADTIRGCSFADERYRTGIFPVWRTRRAAPEHH